ncbi:T-cell immunomodulatory protein-like [Gigantopelta aegis]|uniref:T-cell immunomodulatory protein-like n=1 Tax=Gigantopelta aegis TaxID=1735272 RepID=UPI001B88B121|nr:T-cell immunomodulatory protein-like [Gigantopelta aegis]
MFTSIGLFLLFAVQYHAVFSLSDITRHVFGSDKNGIIAAFGDFNGDRVTDIFSLTDEGNSLLLLLGHLDMTDGHFTQYTLLDKKHFPDSVITGVIPSDFDGDSQMDILVTCKSKGKKSTPVTVHIFWGNGESSVQGVPLTLNETLNDQPAVIDENGDMIPDLFGEMLVENKPQRFFWIFNERRNYTLKRVLNGTSQELSPLKIPQSSAFVDLNGDLTSDLCVASVQDGQLQFEFWYNVNGVLTWNKTIPGPAGAKFPGQPSYTDMEGNLSVDIVLPACVDEACTQSVIYVWSHDKWYNLSLALQDDKTKWNFVPPNRSPHSWLEISPTLCLGDFNLNSFPDALTVLYSNNDGNITYSAFVMNNVDCGSECGGFPRTFRVDVKNPVLPASNKYLVPAFFDLTENGILDIVISSLTAKDSDLRALKQTFTDDACFEKITVVSGRCWNNCSNNHKPFGVNQIGPTVKIHTTKPNGDPQISIASQLTKSAYFSLQLPFILFGLGQTPNFVDTVDVGIPYPPGKEPRHKQWTSVIPNSQLIIVPFPPDHPNRWKNKLFTTPSRLVLLTGSALLGTCGFIAAIIGLLHWRERVEDKKEKLEEAQRFHFDAM